MSRLVFELYFPRTSEIWGGQIDTFDTFELARFDQVSIFVGGAAIIQEVVFQLWARCRAAYWWFSSCVLAAMQHDFNSDFLQDLGSSVSQETGILQR